MTVDEWRTYRRPSDSELDHLDWQPTEVFLTGWPELDADLGDFSPEPSVTHQDVYASLGPQAAEMLNDLDVDVDQLIRLINAETTVLPVIPTVLPPEVEQDRTVGAHRLTIEPEPALAVATQRWKRRFLKGAVVAVLVSMVGGGVAMAMNKSVTLNVDGKAQTVNTFGSTVGDVLEAADIKLGAHDAVSPAPSAEIGEDGVVKLERGRQLTVVVDGKPQQTWVRATTVEDALAQMGKSNLMSHGAWMSAPQDGAVPLKGMTLEVKTLKHITVHDGGEKARKVTTHAVTVSEFLQSKGIKVGSKDEVENGLSRKLKDGSSIHINRTGTFVIKVKEPIEPPVKEIEDDNLEQGKTKVVEAGRAGLELVTYRVTKENNVETGREELASKTLRKPKQRVVRVGTKPAETPNLGDTAVWDRLAECESGGNWSINTGNGYYGGLQFSDSTWDAYGGEQYAAYANEASREQQIAIATKVRDANGGGYGAWPHCSQKLGLPQ